ncbi:MAG: acyl-CoA dehydrogenase family protein [Deltaproteobacteria bacterium]|nr:acyl-CoA dehydrogenase family protein [Deltaproteobacteria bacterium]
MNQFHTEREQRFIDLAATLADEFAQRAARYDEEEAFPYENYARLRESGYTIMTIPEELGGLGARPYCSASKPRSAWPKAVAPPP